MYDHDDPTDLSDWRYLVLFRSHLGGLGLSLQISAVIIIKHNEAIDN